MERFSRYAWWINIYSILAKVSCEQLVNIALNKTPTHSGAISYSSDGQHLCASADALTFSGTVVVDDPWWQLDLRSIFSIHALHVLGRPTVLPRRPNAEFFSLPTYTGHLAGFRLWTGLGMDNISIVYRNNDTAYNHGNIWINTTMIARIIRIDLPRKSESYSIRSGPIVLCEVEVYVPFAAASIKQSSTVSISSVYQAYGAGFALDGKYPNDEAKSPEACNCCSVTAGSERPWWIMDFQIPLMVGRVYITGRRDDGYSYQSKDIMVFISNKRPDPTHRQFGELVAYINNSTDRYMFQLTFEPPRLFRYMTIARPGDRSLYMTICEVDFITAECKVGWFGDRCNRQCSCFEQRSCDPVSGRCPTPRCAQGWMGDNCELNILQVPAGVLHTRQSSQYDGRNSSLAVDGAKGPNPEQCGCCSQTQFENVSWWQVDMGVAVPLREIVVYGRLNDHQYQQLSGFSVFLSMYEHIPDVPYMTEPSSYANVTYRINVDGLYARYIRIQKPGMLTICEVEIFKSEKSCPMNTYSLECLPCGQCKNSLPCDVISGRCTNGCRDDYVGELCMLSTGTNFNISVLVSALSVGSVAVLFVGAMVILKRGKRLRCLDSSGSSQDYDIPNPTLNRGDQHIYDTIDLPEQPDSQGFKHSTCTSTIYVNTTI